MAAKSSRRWKKRMHAAGYLAALRASVAASATPYGYTLTIWTSGAVLSHAHGIPAAPGALLFLLGAVAGYALVGSLAFSADARPVALEPASSFRVGCLHFLSVGLAIGAASLIGYAVSGLAAWLLGGFLATALYLLASAFQLSLVHTARDGASGGAG